jgi:hypothetical protein
MCIIQNDLLVNYFYVKEGEENGKRKKMSKAYASDAG